MRTRLAFLLVAVGANCVFATFAPAQTSDPVQAIKSFSDFQQIDLSRVLNGDILSERDAPMNFPNGISAQTCYVMALPADDAARHLQMWNPLPFPELKVFAFHALHTPCELGDFQSLDFRMSQSPIRWLLGKTIATTPTRSDLNLTRDEAKQLSACLPKPPDPAKASELLGPIAPGPHVRIPAKGSRRHDAVRSRGRNRVPVGSDSLHAARAIIDLA